MVQYVRREIPIKNLVLDTDNPREPSETQEDAIEWLCKNEKISELAGDIAKNGLNPLDSIGVLKINSEDNWLPLEGNRRVCALKLLNDPGLAPTTALRHKFRELHQNWQQHFETIECVCFETREEANIWLERLHNGAQNGFGRHAWNAIQIQRWSDSPRNKRALIVLEYGIKKGWLSPEDMHRKLTTATRYLNNANLRSVLGLGEDKAQLMHMKSQSVFDNFIKDFIDDLGGGKVSSRSNTPDIEKYANSLLEKHLNIYGDSDDIRKNHEAISIRKEVQNENAHSEQIVQKSRAKKPRKARKKNIPYIAEFDDTLRAIDNTKLQDLYRSLCLADVNDNNLIPLITVGAWSFVESLASELGKNERVSFTKFYSSFYQDYKSNTRRINQILDDLARLGNLTKHDEKYTNYNGEALIQIMEIVVPFLIYSIKKIKDE